MESLLRTPPYRPEPIDASSTRPGRRRELAERVVGRDDREPVADVSQAPFRQICSLRMVSRWGSLYSGTGWLAAPRLVITAGHCVYFHDERRWADHIVVRVGRDGDRAEAVRTSGELLAPSKWVSRGTDAFDYGAIVLDEPVDVGALAFGAFEDDELRGASVSVTGYPGDLQRGARQYTHERTVTTISADRISYDIDTFSGQSGSPVWSVVGGVPVVVGIHTQGEYDRNSGLRITSDVLATLRAWKRRTT